MENKNLYPFILITGASGGIGRSISVLLSQTSNLILHGTDESKLKETKNLCSKKFEQLLFKHNFCELESLETSFVEFMTTNKISVTHLIHCAGKAPILPNSRTKINQLYEIFNVNLFSAIILCKLLAKSSINSDVLKTIVFISSNLSPMGASGMTLYGASKSGLDGYMRSLAIELAPNIRVNSVLPGPISTEMTKDFITSIDANELKKYPLGFGQTDDIAEIVKFLISSESKWISGQQFIVDGGRSINLSM